MVLVVVLLVIMLFISTTGHLNLLVDYRINKFIDKFRIMYLYVSFLTIHLFMTSFGGPASFSSKGNRNKTKNKNKKSTSCIFQLFVSSFV